MQQRQQPLERGERGGDRRLVAVVEPRLDRLGVPVAEVVEGQVVERVGDVREVEARRASSSISARASSIRARIHRSSSAVGRSAGSIAVGVLQDQPGDVPELVRELARPPRSRPS